MNMRQSADSFGTPQHTLENAKSVLQDVASNAGAKIHKAFSSSKNSIDHAIDAASDSVEHAEEFLIRKIKEKPVSAAAIALGAGVFIGLMISRRD